jgi:hypothetical protein
MIRQRAPVVQTEVDFILSSCNRIGLMNGSRRPAVFTTVATSCFFATGFGAFALASALAIAFFAVGVSVAAFGFAAIAGFVAAAEVGFEAGFTACDAGLLAACVVFAAAGFVAGLVAGVVAAAFAGVDAAGFVPVAGVVVCLAGAAAVCASAVPASNPIIRRFFLIIFPILTSWPALPVRQVRFPVRG